MTTTLEFRQHEEFHRAALHMAGAGALAGLLGHALFHGPGSPWALAMVAAATVVAALSPALRRQIDEVAVRMGFAAMAAAALVLLLRIGQPAWAIAAFSLLFGLAIGWGLRGPRLLLAIACGAGVALLGRYVFLSIGHAQELSSLPAWLVTSAAGAAFSFISVFALLPQHLALHGDSVASTYDELHGSLTGEVRELVDRSYQLWSNANSELARENANRRSLRDGVLRLFAVARRWQSVEERGTQTMASSLVERMESLEKRIADTDDEITRNQYEQAKAALAEQLRYIKDIGISRERVLARMHNYLAAMERLRMAVINLESTNASRDAVDVQPLVNDLEKLGADMDDSSEALIEVERLTSK
ncbi:MAG: hypothetical protein MJE77_13745 [Proteobacteria bacterium]|nr:hypothetical protein [Pseudomonadota bacterium]